MLLLLLLALARRLARRLLLLLLLLLLWACLLRLLAVVVRVLVRMRVRVVLRLVLLVVVVVMWVLLLLGRCGRRRRCHGRNLVLLLRQLHLRQVRVLDGCWMGRRLARVGARARRVWGLVDELALVAVHLSSSLSLKL